MPEIKRTIFQLPFLLFAFALHAQVQDSLLLHPENLAEKDIYTPIEKTDKDVKIISGSRFPISAADLPFSTYVITRDDIRLNGYETLVDALKMVPGFRVSQPGSASEGETFQMRGLLGNTYAKILINDVPVKPAFVPSMPIGAQLPIKEAERIEIIYGAGAALYGSDASAGVINIITRESDKPVFMQADLAVGGGVFSSANVMFGGRLGRDKRIFKYFAYGSNVIMERRKIFYDEFYNYNPTTYTSDTSYTDLPNYGGSAQFPNLTSTPHLSRKFGFNLKYRGITLSAETMYRRDHSSLGLNPVSYSYRNPQTFTGEGILKFNLNIYKDKEDRNRKTDITYIRYDLDSRSSILPVRNHLSDLLLNSARARSNFNQNDSTLQYFTKFYNRYLDGLRYMFGQSDEWRMEHVRNYRLLKFVTLTMGANGKFAKGYPRVNYLSRPATEEQNKVFGYSSTFLTDETLFPILPFNRELFELNGFGQAFYNGKKFNIAAGANYSVFTLEEDWKNAAKGLSPRVSGLYNISKSINVRSSWGTAFKAPNPYYRNSSYDVQSNRTPVVKRTNFAIASETTTSWENGIRYKTESGRLGADATWFLNKTRRLLRFTSKEGFDTPDSTLFSSQLGYGNLEDFTIRYTGGQVSFFLDNSFNGKKVANGLISYSWINYDEAEFTTFEQRQLTPPKGSMWQIRTSFIPLKKSLLILDLIKYKNIAQGVGERPEQKFWTCDIVWRYSFTDRFDGYVKIINLFNKGYSGILPEGDPNDLLHYNPQSGFFLRLGMNYYIE